MPRSTKHAGRLDEKKRSSQKIAERNRTICDLREQGRTLEEIGGVFGLTRERVRQVINRAGAVTALQVREIRLQKNRKKIENLQNRFLDDIKKNPGSTVEEVAERLFVSAVTLRKALPREMRAVFLIRQKAVDSRWNTGDAIDAIRFASTYEFPLTKICYEKLISYGELKGPSFAWIFHHFGSWKKACEMAGVECGTTYVQEYNSNWTDEDLFAFVSDYLGCPGSTGSVVGYDEWRGKVGNDAPSSATLRNRLGKWSQIKFRYLREVENRRFP